MIHIQGMKVYGGGWQIYRWHDNQTSKKVWRCWTISTPFGHLDIWW